MSADGHASGAVRERRDEALVLLDALCRNYHKELVQLALLLTEDQSRSEEVVQVVY